MKKCLGALSPLCLNQGKLLLRPPLQSHGHEVFFFPFLLIQHNRFMFLRALAAASWTAVEEVTARAVKRAGSFPLLFVDGIFDIAWYFLS